MMSDAIGPGDLVLCVDGGPGHNSGTPVELVTGETYIIAAVSQDGCACKRPGLVRITTAIGWWCQSRFRLLPKPKKRAVTRKVSKPRELSPAD